jgi:mitochondrial fission protein ELM1
MGNLEKWSYSPLDDALQVAAVIRQRFATRLTSS